MAKDIASEYLLLDEKYLYIEEKETDKFISRHMNDINKYHYMSKNNFEFEF